LVLSAEEGHHAANVLRLKPGAAVELFDGQGGRALGRIETVERRRVAIAIERLEAKASRPGPIVHLAFAVPKGARLDWLLEKATELGAASLRPVLFERSVAGGEELSPAKRQRWLTHCVAAAKQCGLDFLPAIEDPVSLADLLAAPADEVRLLGDTDRSSVPPREALAGQKGGRAVLLLVGPVGGLTVAERERALAAGFTPVRLGGTTLRVETAAEIGRASCRERV
jgi:16S rRNA (uracil1498-N3)-methyltransferase